MRALINCRATRNALPPLSGDLPIIYAKHRRRYYYYVYQVLCGGSQEEKLDVVFKLFDRGEGGGITGRDLSIYLNSAFRVMYKLQPGLAEEVKATCRNPLRTRIWSLSTNKRTCARWNEYRYPSRSSHDSHGDTRLGRESSVWLIGWSVAGIPVIQLLLFPRITVMK